MTEIRTEPTLPVFPGFYSLTVEHEGVTYAAYSPLGLYAAGVPELVICLSIEELERRAADQAIEAAAGRARDRYAPAGASLALTYDLKAGEAAAFLALAPAKREEQIAAGGFPILVAESEARGVTVLELAQAVHDVRANLSVIIGMIEAARVTGKAEVAAATGADIAAVVAAIAAARDAAVATLNAL